MRSGGGGLKRLERLLQTQPCSGDSSPLTGKLKARRSSAPQTTAYLLTLLVAALVLGWQWQPAPDLHSDVRGFQRRTARLHVNTSAIHQFQKLAGGSGTSGGASSTARGEGVNLAGGERGRLDDALNRDFFATDNWLEDSGAGPTHNSNNSEGELAPRGKKSPKYEDANAMKARLIKEIESAKAQGVNVSDAQRQRLAKEIDHLKMEMERVRRKKMQAEEELKLEVSEEEDEQAYGSVEVDPLAEEEDGEEAGTGEGAREVGKGARITHSPGAPVGSPGRQAHIAALGKRVRECTRRAGVESATLLDFPLSLPEDLPPEDLFLNQQTRARAPPESQMAAFPPHLLPVSGQAVLAKFTWGKCAVVGSSGALAGAGHGSIIDSHDIVLRFNHAPTLSHQDHVGSKTTFRILNRKWTQAYAAREPKVGGKKLPLEGDVTLVSTRTSADLFGRLKHALNASHPGLQVIEQNSRTVTYASDILGAYRECVRRASGQTFSGGSVPSLALVMVLTLLQVCQEVTVYGCGSASTRDKPARFHYFKTPTLDITAPDKAHSLAAEASLLRALAHSDLLTLCTAHECIRDRELQVLGERWQASQFLQGHSSSGTAQNLQTSTPPTSCACTEDTLRGTIL
eukprot:CAMPEP_0196584442 /NCGR_PEP_ID=MMETSP1081-20130531/47083_1 /TAXON_ID=36882 /ORGANISM="Pyramimonas amylifera, Strain CCMP720" /LENGTH=627 /DNA_ID=CAMNT_0041905647 /DNA_START=254 /DNA_END=2138 /DNA_ORIENTATION=-